MSSKAEFNLTDQQKIAFGEQAVARIAALHPQFPAPLKVFEVLPQSMIFSTGRDLGPESALAFTFCNQGARCFCMALGHVKGDFTDDIQPLYLDYMCQTFGEPFRAAALTFWQEQWQAEHNAFKSRRAALDQAEQALLAKQNTLLDCLSKGTNQKLRHCATPDMALKDAAQEQETDREKL